MAGADELPAAPSTERPAFEPTIRRPLEGSGHLDASVTALRHLAREEEAQRLRAATVRHPAELALRQAEHEAKLEAQRKAEWPDPAAQLLEAQGALAEAEAELTRHREAADRGAAVLAEARERLAGARAERTAAQNIAAVNMARAIARQEALPEPETYVFPPPDLAAVEHEVEIADGAHQQLEVAAAAATKVVREAAHRVYAADHALRVADADQFAIEIEDLQAKLEERRRWLRNIAEHWVRPPGGSPHPVRITARSVRALG